MSVPFKTEAYSFFGWLSLLILCAKIISLVIVHFLTHLRTYFNSSHSSLLAPPTTKVFSRIGDILAFDIRFFYPIENSVIFYLINGFIIISNSDIKICLHLDTSFFYHSKLEGGISYSFISHRPQVAHLIFLQ